MRLQLACFLVVAALCFGACSGPSVGAHSSVVGGACGSAGDCATQCQTTSHFPGGMCTRACASDADCPAGAVCIDEDASTICAVACQVAADCADFGRGYTCDDVDHATVGGKVNVCRAP